MPQKDKDARRKYNNAYDKTHRKRISLDVNTNYFNDIIAPIPDITGLPVNTFIKIAIAEKIRRDGMDLPIDLYTS